MKKNLVAVGNSLGIIIEKPILDLLGIDKESQLEMITDGKRLILEPVKEEDRTSKIKSATRRVMKNHDKTLRKLAKWLSRNSWHIEDVLLIHEEQLEAYGGIRGIRDSGLLESAVMMPQASFGGEYLHQGLFEMAAAYAFHIAENQPFLDGNKRAALVSALVFLDINGFEILDEEMKLYDAIAIANKEMDKSGLGKLLKHLSEK